MNFPSFPAVHNFAVCIVLHVPWRAHRQRHMFGVSFEDADGKETSPRLEGQFQAGPLPDMRTGDYSIAPIAIGVTGFVFQRPGDYSAVLYVDGTEINRWRFRAVQVFGVPGPPSPPAGGPDPAAIPGPPTA